jgi:L-threonylcarbamoyladenylate synthase
MPQPSSTRVLVVDPESPDPSALDQAARVLAAGDLVAFATETVYGLGADATDAAAVERIFAAKGRPSVNPLIMHVADVGQARQCVAEWPEDAERLATRFWPGPLTLVLRRSDRIPDVVTAGKSTVGVRCPAGNVARGLIARCCRPIAAPSANRSNRLSPTRAEHVLADLDGRIDLILDSGPTAVGLESTVLDLTSDPPRLLRPGPITAEELEAALSGRPLAMPVAGAAADRPASPGQMPVHYSPRTPAFRVASPEELKSRGDLEEVAILTFGTGPVLVPRSSGRAARLESPELAARRLYDVLHDFDASRPRAIVVVMPPERPEWLAIRDRLLRATRPLPPTGPDWGGEPAPIEDPGPLPL